MENIALSRPRRNMIVAALTTTTLLAGCGGGGEDGGSLDFSSYLPTFDAPAPLAIGVLTRGFTFGSAIASDVAVRLADPSYQNTRTSIAWLKRNYDPSVPDSATNYPLSSSRTVVAHAAGYTGAGTVIAFTDEHFSAGHEVFAGKSVEILNPGPALVDDGSGQLVPNIHGIAVASVAAGKSAGFTGTAPDAGILFSTWDEQSMADLGNKARTDGAVAWNNSWGYRGLGLNTAAFDTVFTSTAGQNYLAALNNYVASDGVVVFAVSNEDLRNSTLMDGLPVLRNSLEAGWLAVANGVPTLNGTSVASVHLVSNACWESARWCLVADGSWNAASGTTSEYQFWTGSSFAAPQVSGALAILKQAFPDLTPQQLRVRLLASAEDSFFRPDATVELADGFFKGYSVRYGHGFLDVEAALNPIGPTAMAMADGGRVAVSEPVLMTGSALGDAVEKSLAGRDVAVQDALSATFAMPADALTAGARPAAMASTLLAKSLGADLRLERLAVPSALSDPFASFAGPVMTLTAPDGITASVLVPVEGTEAMGFTLARALTDGPMRVELGVKLARDGGGLLSLDGEDAADMASITLGITHDLGAGAFLALSGEVGMTDLGGDTAFGSTGTARFDALRLTAGKSGIFSAGDRLTAGIGMPVAVASGRTELTLPTLSKQGASFQNVSVDVAPDSRQLDLDLTYQTALTDALEVKLSLVHSDDFGNRAGETDTGGMMALTWRF